MCRYLCLFFRRFSSILCNSNSFKRLSTSERFWMYIHFQLVPLLITNCSVPDFKIDYNLDYIPTPCAHAIDERSTKEHLKLSNGP